MNIVNNILDELLKQFILWDNYLQKKKYETDIIRVSHGAVIAIIQSKNAKRHREINNSDEIFEWYWVGKYLQDVRFDEFVEIVNANIVNQEKEIERMKYLFNRIYPIVEILELTVKLVNE